MNILHQEWALKKVVIYRVGYESFPPRDEWAAKNFLVKSHLNLIPPPAINNDQSLGLSETYEVGKVTG